MTTSSKPTTMVELNGRLLAVAMGSPNDDPSEQKIELWSYIHKMRIGVINAHTSMIDSMLLLYQPSHRKILRGKLNFTSTLLTCGRDKKFKIWRIYPFLCDYDEYDYGQFDYNHSDYVRSLLQIETDSFVSGSEDKTVRIYKFNPAS